MDFGALPPEINSGLMYSGPGSGSLLEAASAWDGLATDLTSSASEYLSVVDSLKSLYFGPSADAMFDSASKYQTWMTETAEMASVSARAVTAAASAYQTALSSVVYPPVIFLNRAELATLVATNLLGQNTPAIAANQAEYAEFWAQDAAAMYTYQADGAAATAALPQFSPAPQITTGAATAQSLSSTLQTDFSSSFLDSNLFNGVIGGGMNPATLLPILGSLFLMNRSNDLTAEGNRISQDLAKDDEQQLGQSGSAGRFPVNPGEAPTYPENSPRAAERPPVSMGNAHTAGNLSVPPAWNKATEQVRLASAASPLSAAGAPLIPTPIAAVNSPKRERKRGEEVLVVKFELPRL